MTFRAMLNSWIQSPDESDDSSGSSDDSGSKKSVGKGLDKAKEGAMNVLVLRH